MAVLTILQYPNPRLRKIAKPVAAITSATNQIIADMLETMYAHEGIGLAATQVDIHQQIIVIDVSETRDKPLVLLNAQILRKQGATSIEEGCLSIIGERALVPRSAIITVSALNQANESVIFEANELLAICMQHEIDHLNGKLFIDYLSPFKQERIHKRVLKKAKLMENSKQ